MPFEVVKARDRSPLEGSLTIPVGPPGLGKSWFAGTMAEYLKGEVLVIATLPREGNSYLYQKHNLDTVFVTDDEWDPSARSFKATGYDKLMEIGKDLRKDTKYGGIILDNGTEAGELAWHSALAPLGIGDPNDMPRGGNRFGPYTAMSAKLGDLITRYSFLTGKSGLVERPKLVCIPWHVQPQKEAMADEDSADEKGHGVEYEGNFLPMIRGSFRRRLMAVVDNFVYADIVSVAGRNELSKKENKFCIQVVSDREKHVKTGGVVADASKLIDGKYLDVHNREDAWRMFMEIIAQKPVTAGVAKK